MLARDSGNKPEEPTPAGKPKPKPKPAPDPNSMRQIQFPPGPVVDEAGEQTHYRRMDDLEKRLNKLGGEVIVLAVERLHEQECSSDA